MLVKTTGVKGKLEYYMEKQNNLQRIGLMERTIFPVEMQAAEL